MQAIPKTLRPETQKLAPEQLLESISKDPHKRDLELERDFSQELSGALVLQAAPVLQPERPIAQVEQFLESRSASGIPSGVQEPQVKAEKATENLAAKAIQKSEFPKVVGNLAQNVLPLEPNTGGEPLLLAAQLGQSSLGVSKPRINLTQEQNAMSKKNVDASAVFQGEEAEALKQMKAFTSSEPKDASSLKIKEMLDQLGKASVKGSPPPVFEAPSGSLVVGEPLEVLENKSVIDWKIENQTKPKGKRSEIAGLNLRGEAILQDAKTNQLRSPLITGNDFFEIQNEMLQLRDGKKSKMRESGQDDLKALGNGMLGTLESTGVSKEVLQFPARVIPGAMTELRMDNHSLTQWSQGVSTLKEKGGGEIQIRLHPENLGSLRVKVSTTGNVVDLQIHAATPEAQRAIERSIPQLREKLASQDLRLDRADVTVMSFPGATETAHKPASIGSSFANQWNDNPHSSQQQSSQGQTHLFDQDARNRRTEVWKELVENTLPNEKPKLDLTA